MSVHKTQLLGCINSKVEAENRFKLPSILVSYYDFPWVSVANNG